MQVFKIFITLDIRPLILNFSRKWQMCNGSNTITALFFPQKQNRKSACCWWALLFISIIIMALLSLLPSFVNKKKSRSQLLESTSRSKVDLSLQFRVQVDTSLVTLQTVSHFACVSPFSHLDSLLYWNDLATWEKHHECLSTENGKQSVEAFYEFGIIKAYCS